MNSYARIFCSSTLGIELYTVGLGYLSCVGTFKEKNGQISFFSPFLLTIAVSGLHRGFWW